MFINIKENVLVVSTDIGSYSLKIHRFRLFIAVTIWSSGTTVK